MIGIGERSIDNLLVDNESFATITPEFKPQAVARGQTPPIHYVAVTQAPIPESQPASSPSVLYKSKAAVDAK